METNMKSKPTSLKPLCEKPYSKPSLSNQSLLKSDALINGRWVKAENNNTFPVFNPANEAMIAEVAECGKEETLLAISSAHAALAQWKQTPAKERSALLMTWYHLMITNKNDLAAILTAEQGKPLAEAVGEILYGASYIKWFAEEAMRIYGDTIPNPSKDKRLVILKQPVGVVACITPWNFPNAMLARKIAPALAAGCTVVCKPANETPLSALALAELAQCAGIPPGVINILCGKTAEIGKELTSSTLVRKLTFTGSTPVGKKLTADCAVTMKRTSMELGGNAPFIVFDDADLDEAVDGAMISKFRNAGQTCVCTNRILVQKSVLEAFTKKFAAAAKKLQVGPGTEPGATIGPLINKREKTKVCALIKDALEHGAQPVIGAEEKTSNDNFVSPTILANATTNMRLFREEIFGPVAPIFSFESEEDALEMANDTPFGLAAYFYTRDIGRVWRVSEELEYGMVGINTGVISNEMAPFGGIKESGQGREGSKYGLEDYLELKSMCIGGIDK